MSTRLAGPLSFRAHHPNLPQEAGGAPMRSAVKMLSMESQTAAAAPLRIGLRRFRLSRWFLPIVVLVLQWIVSGAHLPAAVITSPHLTFIVYADHSMPDEEWTDLSAALGKEFEDLALETHFAPAGIDIVRGETIPPGMQSDSAIPIFLHGNCRLRGQPSRHELTGALGWVLRDGVQIRPIIHIDCARIVEMLGQQALSMRDKTRNAAMAEAIARIAVHEWVHIATQSPAHTHYGIEKRSFSVQDLVPGYVQMIPHSSGK